MGGTADWPEPYNSSAIGVIDVLSYTTAGCKEYSYVGYDNSTKFKQNCTMSRRRPELTRLPAMVDIIATQCVYYPCMKNYQASIKLGIVSERVVSTVPATPDVPGNKYMDVTMNYTAIKQPCFMNGIQYDASNFSLAPSEGGNQIYYNFTDMVQTPVPQHCNFNMETTYAMALNAFMSSAFNETGLGDSRQMQPFGIEHGVMDNVWYLDGSWWLSSLYNKGNTTFEIIDKVFDSVSTAFTNHVRNAGIDTGASLLHDPAEMIFGEVFHTTVCFKFAWEWLIFPAALICATLVIMAMMVISSMRDPQQLPIWKSSLLPLLYYGFGKEEHERYDEQEGRVDSDGVNGEAEPLLGPTELIAAAGERVVVFRRTERGARFLDVDSKPEV
jgi:hypothetical protein